MSIATQKVEDIRDAAQELVEAAEALLELREDPDADRDEKADANDEFDNTIRYLVTTLPKAAREGTTK